MNNTSGIYHRRLMSDGESALIKFLQAILFLLVFLGARIKNSVTSISLILFLLLKSPHERAF